MLRKAPKSGHTGTGGGGDNNSNHGTREESKGNEGAMKSPGSVGIHSQTIRPSNQIGVARGVLVKSAVESNAGSTVWFTGTGQTLTNSYVHGITVAFVQNK